MMNKRVRRKKEKQSLRNFNDAVQTVKSMVNTVVDTIKADPSKFREKVVNSTLNIESKAYWIVQSYKVEERMNQ
jgi:hypothetical protein